MHINNIEKLLFEKSNNRLVKRYIKYINICKIKNIEAKRYDEHHILPKADDMFPEYADLKVHRWNCALLTPRQHIWAHIMLWKIFGNNSSQGVAMHYILNVQNSNTIDKSTRDIPLYMLVRFAEKAREAYKEYRIGKGVYKDKEGNIFLLPFDDPRVISGDLVGNMKGHKMTENSKEKFRRAKDPYRTTQVYKFDGSRQSKSILVSDLQKYINTGWQEEKPDEYIFDAKEKQRSKTSEALTGTTTFYYPSGTYYGRIPHDSPIIKELGLVHIRSDKQKAQATENALKNAQDPVVQEKKSIAVSQLNWYHNPETQERMRLKECPVGWKDGRGDTKVNHGKIVYNDGIKNYMLKPGEVPDPSWQLGMAPQKVRVTNYTDGNTWLLLKKGEVIPPGFKRAKKSK